MSITAFAIASQSVGHVELTMLSDGHNAPANLVVTNRVYDDNSQLVSEETKDVAWITGSDGFVGRVVFDGNSGMDCYAYVHKANTEKPLATFSYTAP